jgi:hypothetical protein
MLDKGLVGAHFWDDYLVGIDIGNIDDIPASIVPQPGKSTR